MDGMNIIFFMIYLFVIYLFVYLLFVLTCINILFITPSMLFQIHIAGLFVRCEETKEVEVAHTPVDKVNMDKPVGGYKFKGTLKENQLILKGDTQLTVIKSLVKYSKDINAKKDSDKKDSDKKSEITEEDLKIKEVVVDPKFLLTGKEDSSELLKIAKDNKIEIKEEEYKDAKDDAEKIKIILKKMTFKDITLDLEKADLEKNTDNIFEFILVDVNGKEFLTQTGKITVDKDNKYTYTQKTPIYTQAWFWIVIVIAIIILAIGIAMCCK